MVEKLLNKIAIDTTPHYKWEGTPVLGKYKLNYEAIDEKIWTGKKTENRGEVALRPRILESKVDRLLSTWKLKFKRIGEDK